MVAERYSERCCDMDLTIRCDELYEEFEDLVEVFGTLTQCRTKHTFLGEYYARFIQPKRHGVYAVNATKHANT